MGEKFIRHLVAVATTLVCILAYYAGYYSGGHGWWWTVFSMAIIYGSVYHIVDK